ncbi:hypothetical protein IEO21_08488 [Rhodonia placenta]|uniref:DUF6535 domain-containing protein n=1 Tax=Rhodonia placenta TaxID=104341 RepID=A0A8H7NW75_9APHY|nr:hypothetical protein IEO21_08488 [Postia placenta]
MRRRSLEKWHVRVVIDLLPVLLQISLALFLIGLLELLWALSHVVAAIVTALVIILLLPTLVTVFLPYIFWDCPYKSRAAWLCFVILQRAARASPYGLVKQVVSSTKGHSDHLCKVAKRFLPWLKRRCNDFVHTVRRPWSFSWLGTWISHIAGLPCEFSHRGRAAYRDWSKRCSDALEPWRKWHSDTSTAQNWREFENQLARAEKLEEKDKLMVLAEADELIMDDAFLLKVVRPCLQQSSLESAVPVLLRILHHRAHKVGEVRNERNAIVWPTYQWLTSEQDSAAIIFMGDICLDVLQKYPTAWFYKHEHVVDHVLQLIRAMPPTDSSRAVCRRGAEYIQLAAEHQYLLHETRIDVLDDGADACFLEFVVPAWFKALSSPAEDYELDPFYKILARRWDSVSTMDSKTAAALAGLILDLLLKSPWHPQATHLLERLSHHNPVNQALSFRESNRSVYTRLVDILCTTQITESFRNRLVDWILNWDRLFSLDIECTRRLLAYPPTARNHLSTKDFLRIASSALVHSTKHSSASFRQIREDVKHALDIVAEYFSSSDIDEMVRKITQEDAWHALYWLLDACSDLAERAADLFSRDIVKALGGCARQAPKDYPREYGIMHSMYKIYNFTGITAKSNLMKSGKPEMSRSHLML